MRTSSITAVILAVLLAADRPRPAAAQWIELPETVQAPPIDGSSYSAQLVGQLETEIANLIDLDPSVGELEDLAQHASINYRLLAAELLAAGDRAGARGSSTVMAGFRLVWARREVDAALEQLRALGRQIEAAEAPVDAGTRRRFERARLAIQLFSETWIERAADLRAADPSALDPILATILAPLAHAVSALERKSLANHWIPARAVPARAVSDPTTPRPANTLGELRQRLTLATLRADTRQEIVSILDTLERGAAFPDLKPYVAAYRRRISQVLDLADSLVGADWLEQATRETYSDRMHRAVLLFKEKQTRDRGDRQIRRLDVSRVVIERISVLASARARTEPIESAFLAAEAMIEVPAQADLGRQQLAQLAVVLDRMIDFRELARGAALPRELRVVQRDLERAYRESEKALLEEIDTITTNPRALADPAFGSLLTDQMQYLEDLHRIRELPAWVDTIRLLRPQAAGGFSAHVRRLSRWLLDPNRRPDAVLALARFERELKLFYPLPFEQELHAGSRNAVIATGDRHQQLLTTLETARSAWAEAWSKGQTESPAAQRLGILHRLAQTMADSVEVLRLEGDPEALNRWAAWDMDPPTLARATRDLPNRLKIATAAAIDGDEEALVRELDRIDDDMPLARLVGRFALLLGDAVQTLPGGAVGTLGQFVETPPPDAWMIRHRFALADVCRYAVEQNHAESNGRRQRSDDLALYVNAVANGILRELDRVMSDE